MNAHRHLALLGLAFALGTPLGCQGCEPVAADCETDDDCDGLATCVQGVCEAATAEGEGEGEGEGADAVQCVGPVQESGCLEDRPQDQLPIPYTCDGTRCVDPDTLLAACAAGQAAERYAGGPVMLDVTTVSVGNDGVDCPAAAGGYGGYFATVYSEEPWGTNLATERLKVVDASGAASPTFLEAGLEIQADPIAPDSPYSILQFYVCGDVDALALQLTNNTGTYGNAFCLSLRSGD